MCKCITTVIMRNSCMYASTHACVCVCVCVCMCVCMRVQCTCVKSPFRPVACRHVLQGPLLTCPFGSLELGGEMTRGVLCHVQSHVPCKCTHVKGRIRKQVTSDRFSFCCRARPARVGAGPGGANRTESGSPWGPRGCWSRGCEWK